MRNLTVPSGKAASTPMDRLRARKQRKPVGKSTFSPEKARPIAERQARELLAKQQSHPERQTDHFVSTSSSTAPPQETALATRKTASHLTTVPSFEKIVEALMHHMEKKAAEPKRIEGGMETMSVGGSPSPSIQSVNTSRSGSSGARTPEYLESSFLDINTLMQTMHAKSPSPSIQSVSTGPSRTPGDINTGGLGSPFLTVSGVPSQVHSPFSKAAKLPSST